MISQLIDFFKKFKSKIGKNIDRNIDWYWF